VSDAAPGLRDRKKATVRSALVEAGLRLFRERGFEAVTVDEIAAAADVSRRTFFRYFATKEAALFARRQAHLERLREQLAAAPGRHPYHDVRAALLALAREYRTHARQILAEQRIVRANPWLVARDLEVDRAFEHVVAEHLAKPAGRSITAKRRARIVAAAVVGAVRVTLEEWADRNGELDLARVGAEALDLLAPLTRER
jgi:AcrR family transcriptional regulator